MIESLEASPRSPDRPLEPCATTVTAKRKVTDALRGLGAYGPQARTDRAEGQMLNWPGSISLVAISPVANGLNSTYWMWR